MKNILTTVLLFAGLNAFAQSGNEYTIAGKIQNLNSKKMYFSVKDDKAPRGSRQDSIMVKPDGSFSYKGTIDKITYINIWVNDDKVMKMVKGGGYYPVKSSQLQIIAAPGAKIKVAGKISDFVDAYPSGTPANNDLAKLNKKINPLTNESVNMSLKIANKEVTDSVEIKKMNAKMEQLDIAVNKIKEDFISKNNASVAAIWLLQDMMLRRQLENNVAQSLFEKMNKEKLVSVPYYVDAAKRVDGMSATAIGKMVPDIKSMNTYDGKAFDLASLRGKYVIIDFWGTWCGPCISGMPKMKEYLDKYSSKLEIVGVAQESDDGINWKNFITKNPNYKWHHVLSRNNEDYILKFNVAGFPTKILVDPQGKIVSRTVGEGEEFYAELDKALN
ncbi:MAG: AhpC/TSA family protein [Chitinophagaceae bacterium]|nr:MAG: AhpC/TSA family protein [Chitinophagaceae bacterium]